MLLFDAQDGFDPLDEEFTGLRAATDGGVKALTGMMQQVRRLPSPVALWRGSGSRPP
jgi:hypothetical protein